MFSADTSGVVLRVVGWEIGSLGGVGLGGGLHCISVYDVYDRDRYDYFLFRRREWLTFLHSFSLEVFSFFSSFTISLLRFYLV